MDDKESGAGSDRGPCYRCLFPKPPAPEMAGSCEETGILGAVTGVIGSLQALEAIKIIADLHGENMSKLFLVIIIFFDDTDVYELFVTPPPPKIGSHLYLFTPLWRFPLLGVLNFVRDVRRAPRAEMKANG